MEAPPTSTYTDHLMQAAGIPRPWRAYQVRFDEGARMIHLWITHHPPANAEKKRRSWFGKAPPPAPDIPATGPEMQWRHLNCMDYTCQVHTADRLDERHHHLPWLGQRDLPFSNRLARQVFACLMEGMEIGAICALFNIPFPDLWKFKYALDNGQVRFDYAPAKRTRTAPAAAARPAVHAPAGATPDVTDPLWERLLTGEANIHIKTLSFQLLLTKLRQQVSMQQSDEVKLMKLRELHRYVERNERSLGHELNQFRELARAESA